MKQKKLIKEEPKEIDPSEEMKVDPEMAEFFVDKNSDVKSVNSAAHYDDEGYRHDKKLTEFVSEIFNKSRWTALSINKKVPKDLIPLIFQDLFELMADSEFSFVEKFVAICDFLSVPYAKAYELVNMKYKELIVVEMEKKYQVISKKHIRQIF